MEALKFDNLSNSILSLFKIKRGSYDRCDLIIFPTEESFAQINNSLLAKDILGFASSFYNWLEPKLKEFFDSFNAFFKTKNERVNNRRIMEYKTIITDEECNLRSFRKKMAKHLIKDICAMVNSRKDGSEDKSTEEKRRIIFFNCIKNYIYRLFLIEYGEA